MITKERLEELVLYGREAYPLKTEFQELASIYQQLAAKEAEIERLQLELSSVDKEAVADALKLVAFCKAENERLRDAWTT